LFAFVFIVLISFVPYTYRFKIILNSYGHKVNIFRLMKHTISAFAISYVTIVSRLGGEPIRAWMMKEECNIDYKTGTTVILLDKFVEIFGSCLYGIIGLILLITLFGVPIYFRIIFGALVFLALFLLFLFYYRTTHSKGSFSSLFVTLRLNKIKDWNKFTSTLQDIENKMADFFINHKKQFLLSFFYYCISGIFFIIQFKFLLLSIGFSASISQIILMINVWGLLNFFPTPGALGVLEASQSTLFHLLEKGSATGLALALLLRVCYLSVTILGFLFIILFSRKLLKGRKKQTYKYLKKHIFKSSKK